MHLYSLQANSLIYTVDANCTNSQGLKLTQHAYHCKLYAAQCFALHLSLHFCIACTKCTVIVHDAIV
jgi:hypothetical protein